MLAQFGNYLLDEEIARGGMARVYRARLRGLGGFEKTLVVKQVLPELANDPRFVEMFVEEAKTLVQMTHPHVVPVYELGVIDGVYFLAMEHVDGATLGEVLRDGPLPPALVAHVGVQVCDALDYAHRRFGLVHRDVTPRNVMIDAVGHVRLLDFGIAAPAHDDGESEVFGSPGYMSPEQARGEPIGSPSDLFSLGAVLFEALTGERAFLRETPEQSRAALLEQPPPRLRGRDDVPETLAELVDRALSPDPADRPPSADAMGKTLRGWLAASHPEGVAPQLGDRAELAREARFARRSGPPSSTEEPASTPTSGAVKTLATSEALEAMLEGTPPGRQGDEAQAPGTLPLERQGAASDATPEQDGGTAPIPGRASSAPPTPTADETEEGQAERRGADGEPPGHARGNRGRAWFAAALGAAAAAVAAGIVIPRGGDDPPAEPEGEAAATASSTPAAAQGDDAPATAGGPEAAEPSEPAASPGSPQHTEATADAGANAPGEPDVPARDRHAPPPRSPASLTVSAVPWAEVRLDGRATSPERTPLRAIAIPPGAHRLELRCPPLGTQASATFEAEPGQTVRITADLDRDPPEITVR